MTAPEPFTAEQLDCLERFARSSPRVAIEGATLLHLIAQAREEIRLREAIDSVLTDTRSLEEILSGVTDPAARAKRELGEWLAEDHCRAFALIEPHSIGMQWECMLWLEYDRGDGPPNFFARGASGHEAITAALRAAKEKAMTQPLDPETDNSCWCSDRMSGGIPCPPGTCPNRPKLDPETERHIKWLTDSAAAMDPHCPEASNLYRKNCAHMRKLAQEVAERGINIDTLIRSRDTAQRELSWAQAALAAERTVRENAERELADLRRQYDTLRENHVELQKEAAETKAELERLREAVRWFAASEDVNASLTHWVSGNSECDNEEPLQPDPAAALIKLHERAGK